MSDQSNHIDDEFKPMDLNSLDNFDEELSRKKPETEPDFDRFKLLFDPSKLEEEEVSFEALYSLTKEVKEELFEPLIEGTGIEEESCASPEAGPEAGDRVEKPLVPEKSPEELGFEQGLQKGLAQGLAQGRVDGEAKGFEDGFAKGEAKGAKKGEAEGFAKGEAMGIEQGIQTGKEAGYQEIKAQVPLILDPLKEALETTDRLLERVLARYESQIIELVYKIAEKAVLAQLDIDEQIVKYTILDALKSLVAPEEISLGVSTQDYEYVEMVKEEFFESVRSLKHVAVVSDSMIPKGGCRIESAAATIVTDPESKLRAIYDAIAGAARS